MNRIEVAFLLSQQRATEQLPCVEANFRFHEAIAYATRNHRFVGILEQVHRQSDAAEQWGECGVRLGLQQALHERTNIFAAIKSRDADCARAAMRIHLINGSERCRQWRGADFEKRRLVSTP
ncbi:FadR family transcriptional regulator [Paraburkholderia sp. Ac-20340]|nr:FadR family transcriptional regulator [Paraburkholderia sp. Ac-20340]